MPPCRSKSPVRTLLPDANTQQSVLHSISAPNTIIQMTKQFLVRFRAFLLASLIFSGVAIVLAQPRRYTLRLFGKDIEYFPEVAESSSRARQATPELTLTLEDKEHLYCNMYHKQRKISTRVLEHINNLETATASKEFHCMPNIFRQKHPYLPLIVTRSADRQVAGHVVRIEYDPAKSDRNVVPSIKLSTPYKKLAYFVDLLQEKILDRAYLILAGIAIVLAQPKPSNLRLFGQNIEYFTEVAESSSGAQEEANQGLTLTLKDKAWLQAEELKYHGRKKMSPEALEQYKNFETATASKEIHCKPKVFQEKHPSLPLIMTQPLDSQGTCHHVVRIAYNPVTQRKMVTSIDLAQHYRQLTYYVDLLHEIILERASIVDQTKKTSLTKMLYQWIHQQILGGKPKTSGEKLEIYPLVGRVNVQRWRTLIAVYEYTKTQEELAIYLSGSGTPELAEETAYKVVQNYLAEHIGEKT
ncbi:hypothetical protein PCANC_09175 [Puccinia coronata f. sp. avenae]|uniref:Uncharacterized protein n=1 Tax=Puccinia coronata f. sp. avenae TaxID=200324 RepID=A0A2N5VV62_9BASI|nr:hypothetical protein PCASD_24265 [Puccinia coronata f. sp. avenae]PLW53884.1 hypothetical protein PCANC_09175 [Puccinia coronata f. sp. avenae]